MNESVLIGRSERFLDQIKRRVISINDVKYPENFLEIYSYLKNNLDSLHEMRENMEIKGYTAPYRFHKQIWTPLSGDMKAEDIIH